MNLYFCMIHKLFRLYSEQHLLRGVASSRLCWSLANLYIAAALGQLINIEASEASTLCSILFNVHEPRALNTTYIIKCFNDRVHHHFYSTRPINVLILIRGSFKIIINEAITLMNRTSMVWPDPVGVRTPLREVCNPLRKLHPLWKILHPHGTILN